MKAVNDACRFSSMAREMIIRAEALEKSGFFGNRVEAAVLRDEAAKMLEAVNYDRSKYEI